MELTEEQVRRAIDIAREKIGAKTRDVIIKRAHTQRPVSREELNAMIKARNRNYITPLVIPNDRHNS